MIRMMKYSKWARTVEEKGKDLPFLIKAGQHSHNKEQINGKSCTLRLSEIYGSSKDKQGPNRLNPKGFRQWPGAADASLKTGVWLVTQPLRETERAAKLSADVQGRQATKLETRAWV